MANAPTASNAVILANHYQHTFELMLSTWEKRNHTLLLLLAVVGAATILTFKVSQAEPLLVDLVVKLLDIKGVPRTEELRRSFPYGLIQSILLMVIMYLTLILYHRTATIQRLYKYLARLETELRGELALPANSVSFTREGAFYAAHAPVLQGFVAKSYIAVLGCLLLAFLAGRIGSDVMNGNLLIAAVDILLAAPTAVFFYGYARSS